MWQGGSFGIHDDAGSCMLLLWGGQHRSTIVTVRKGVAWRGTPSVCSFAKDYSALVERKPHRHGGADSSKLVPLLWLACKACGNVSARYTESGSSVVHILNIFIFPWSPECARKWTLYISADH